MVAKRKLVILGATGSIGQTVARVLEQGGDFDVAAMAGGSDGAALARMAVRLGARFAAVSDHAGYAALKQGLAGTGIEAAAGEAAVTAAATTPCDIVVAAIAGTAGVAPTHAALQLGRTIALANKECLVCAGDAFMRSAREAGATLLPMDSEHNAIYQALGGFDASRVETMTLTASGGPFRLWSAQAIAEARLEDALKHPNYAMGRKITVDSAGLMNKGLELIEAHHLFGIAAARLDVLVHPQQIVHGLVSYSDGSVVAGLAAPDMATPVAHCLAHPGRLPTRLKRLDLAAIGTLTFEAPDHVRFPALKLAMEALAHGEGMPTVLNAANDAVVAAYLARKIAFGDIFRLVAQACDKALKDGIARTPATVAQALAVHHMVKETLTPLLA